MRLEGKTAVVTGAASGIGRATAETLARAGADVIIADLSADKGEAEAERLRRSNLMASFMQVDVSSDESIAAFAKFALGRGEVHVLVNGAGWGDIQPFLQNSPDFINKVIAINLGGPVHLAQALLPAMIAANSGKIVNIASDAGRVGSGGETVYAGAKGGLIAFTKSLAREVARYSINVNCVCPGPTDTPMLATRSEKLREAFLKAIPFRRFAKPEEIADAVLFFAGPQSNYITGQVLSVSGGLTFAG